MNYYMKIVWENGDRAIWKIDKNIKTCRCLLPVRIDDGSDKPTYHFVENMNKRPMLMDKDWLINKMIPDKSAIKEFATLDEFMEDNFLEHI